MVTLFNNDYNDSMKKQLRHFLNISTGILKLVYLPLAAWLFQGSYESGLSSPALSALAWVLILLGLSGMAVASLTIFRFGSGGLPVSRVPERLVDVGQYGRTRHPYFWFFLMFQAGLLLLILGLQWLSLICWILILLTGSIYLYFFQERELEQVLGEIYSQYQKETPFWFWKLKLAEDHKIRFLPQMVWLIGRTVFRAWYRIRVEGTENIPFKKPFLVIANHECFLDPFLFGTFIPYEIRFVTTADVFNSGWMRFLLKGIGTFPMRRHRQDLKSIRTMIRMIEAGQVVGIFPEGGRTLYGTPLPILKETLKLIQHCRVPILPVHLDGAYEIWPRWASNRRRGSVTVRFGPVIPVAEQGDLQQLEKLIVQRIFADQKILREVRSPAIARGMDHVLWACRKCSALNSIRVASGNEIHCDQCASRWTATPAYALVDQQTGASCTIIAWMQSIEENMLGKAPPVTSTYPLAPDERLFLKTPINKFQVEDGLPELDGLDLALSNSRFILSRGDAVEAAWPLDAVTVFTMDYYNAVSIGVGGIRHSFFLPATEVSLKWQTFYEKLKANRAQT